jgi:hypothetical protein
MPSAQTGSTRPLAQRLAGARRLRFVGRDRELEVFRSALARRPGASSVLCLHGPGGVGKTTLLHRFADEAAAAGRTVVRVDGRTVEPVPAVFEAEAAAALRTPDAVLLVDTFEQCQGLEDWLRERFLPRLADGAVAVVAGRNPPGVMWQADPAWHEALQVIGLSELARHEASTLLGLLDVPAELTEALLAFTGGHPLALRLAAEVAAGTPADTSAWTPGSDTIGTLLARIVGELPSAAHRHALEVCAHVLATTEELLGAALPAADAGALFGWLRRLPFVESGRRGLFPHDVVRAALDADLRWRDPGSYQEMHRRVRAHLVTRARAASGAAVIPAMEALTYLHRHNGFLGNYVTWRADGSVHEDRYRPEDRGAVVRLVGEAEGPESAAVAQFWLDRQPRAFRLVRSSATGEPLAVTAWLRLAVPDEEEVARDPVVAAAWRHGRRTAPLRGGEHVRLARFLVHPRAYQRPSPVMDVMLHRMVAEFIHADRLAWSYLVLADPGFWHPLMTYIDQHAVAPVPVPGDRTVTLFAHDWRVVPADRWLEASGPKEVFGPAAGPRPVPSRSGPRLAVLSRADVDTATRRALRSWFRPGELASNPLVRSRMVADRTTAGTDPVAALRELLAEAVDALRADPRDARLHRVLTATFFQGASSQEAAAARLGIPFSTYRRHLTRALRLLGDRLWSEELEGRRPERGNTVAAGDDDL